MAFRAYFLWMCYKSLLYKSYNCYKVVECVYSVIGEALLRIFINHWRATVRDTPNGPGASTSLEELQAP